MYRLFFQMLCSGLTVTSFSQPCDPHSVMEKQAPDSFNLTEKNPVKAFQSWSTNKHWWVCNKHWQKTQHDTLQICLSKFHLKKSIKQSDLKVVFMFWLHFGSSFRGVLILYVSILYILYPIMYISHTCQASLFISYIHIYVLFCDRLQIIVLYFI